MAEQPTPGEKSTDPVVPAAETPSPVVPAVKSDPPAAAPAANAKTEVAPAAAAPAPVAEAAPVPEKPAVIPGIPEKYELPDVNPHLLEAMTPVFKKAGVSLQSAQEMAAAVLAFQKDAPTRIMARDLETLKADPKLGGLNLARTQARINDALAAFTTPQERAELTAQGLANNPTLVRMFHRVGASMQEAPQTDAGPPVRDKASRATKLYGGKDIVADKPH